jgi:hypothetical protein
MTKIYLDENIASQIAESLNILEYHAREGFEVRTIASVFGQGVPDEDWIPQIGAEQGVVITGDLRIHHNKFQRELYRKHGLGVIFMPPPSKKRGYKFWEQVEQLVKHWQEIRQTCRNERPFAFEIIEKQNKLKRL